MMAVMFVVVIVYRTVAWGGLANLSLVSGNYTGSFFGLCIHN